MEGRHKLPIQRRLAPLRRNSVHQRSGPAGLRWQALVVPKNRIEWRRFFYIQVQRVGRYS